jgi:hypothetical protein
MGLGLASRKIDSRLSKKRWKTPKGKVYKKSIDRIVDSTSKIKRKSVSIMPRIRLISPFGKGRESLTVPRKKISFIQQQNSVNRLYNKGRAASV